MTKTTQGDSDQYRERKSFFKQLLTIYGRKPVLEALQDPQLAIYKIHLADSNKVQGIIKEIATAAENRGIDIEYHDKKSLSRISKNGKQDQGVAADIKLRQNLSVSDYIRQQGIQQQRFMVLDRITNPQNLGMIIRSVTAGNIDGLVIPEKGCASLSPLVVKASTGTLFRAPLLHCSSLTDGLKELQQHGVSVCTLSSHAKESLFDYRATGAMAYVLGNETEGVSKEVAACSDIALKIPMNNEVESLNVAITAALIAFLNK